MFGPADPRLRLCLKGSVLLVADCAKMGDPRCSTCLCSCSSASWLQSSLNGEVVRHGWRWVKASSTV
jgi:hypothetical protein